MSYRSEELSLEEIVYWFEWRILNNKKNTDMEYYMVKRIITYGYCKKVGIFSAWFNGYELPEKEGAKC